MNEELEVLGKNIRYKKEYVGNDTYRLYIKKNEIELLEKYLAELEQIKNANPSEALKCLERIDNTLCLNNIKGKLEFDIDTEEHTDCDSVIGMAEDLDTIKQALLKSQEQEKVLEIIKGKEVNIESLKGYDLEEYNMIYENKLSQQEFELLKRWLNGKSRSSN